jgi:hypothetical protein
MQTPSQSLASSQRDVSLLLRFQNALVTESQEQIGLSLDKSVAGNGQYENK